MTEYEEFKKMAALRDRGSLCDGDGLPGDAAANASVAADVAHAAGNVLGSLAEAAESSGSGNSGQGSGTSSGTAGTSAATGKFSLSDVPDYTGSPYVAVNGNVPYFTEDDLTDVSFESYSDLDSLGRCGVAYASVWHRYDADGKARFYR